MTFYIKRGNTYNVTANQQLDIKEILPVGTYTVKLDPMTGFYLEMVDDFKTHGKIYGDTVQVAHKILDTFESRPNATGVMLSGEQGSGKTLQGEVVSIEARDRGIPTFVINSAFAGESFNTFMQSIEQPIVVLFDEFEKVYDSDEQERLLTLLDGVYPTKKLFVLTCNDKFRVNRHMKNRPGRIFYHLEYRGLSVEFVSEYAKDNLKNQDHVDGVARLSLIFSEFNFDMLKALIEEMNRYDESPQDALKMLNAKPENGGQQSFEFILRVNGSEVDKSNLYDDSTWHGNPLNAKIEIDYKLDEVDEDGDQKYDNVEFASASLKKIDADKGTFLFVNENGDSLLLKKKVSLATSYDQIFAY